MSELKIKAAQAALEYVSDHRIIGVGTGTTVSFFIEELRKLRGKIDACVASSKNTAEKLKAAGFSVVDLNTVDLLPVYFDSADEVNHAREMIKGGGGALTQEKIVASVAKQFVCFIDEHKYVTRLGEFPVAVEVIPSARSFVAREIVKLGGNPVYRQGFVTDQGNCILDVFNLDLYAPEQMENSLKQLIGVVENGVFARRTADSLLVAGLSKVYHYPRKSS